MNTERNTTTITAGRPAVATEVLLLWPRGVPGAVATAGEAGLWPVFVMVVTEPDDVEYGPARPAFELLDRPRHDGELTVVAAETSWSLLDPAHALLDLDVRAALPVAFELRILLPAAPVLGILDVVARGATIGITTHDRADRLRGRVDIATALRDVLLLSCDPSVELEALASVLFAARDEMREPGT